MDAPGSKADPHICGVSARNDDGFKDVSSSTASVQSDCIGVSNSNDLAEQIHDITLTNKDVRETCVPVSTKDDILVGEDGELDYEEDEGEEEKPDDKETAQEELEEGELEEEGEEGEILSDEENKVRLWDVSLYSVLFNSFTTRSLLGPTPIVPGILIRLHSDLNTKSQYIHNVCSVDFRYML